MSARRYIVADADEIPTGGQKIVTVGGRSIGILNVDGEYFAIRNRCPHQGGPLCRGPLLRTVEWSPPASYEYGRQHLMQCPWHGWEFDIRTGKSWFDPDRWRVRRYEVEVADEGQVAGDAQVIDATALVPGPYEAETYPVTAGARYIVVEM